MKTLVAMMGSPRTVTSWRCHAINHSPDVLMLHETNLFARDSGHIIRDKDEYMLELARNLAEQPLPDYKDLPYDDMNQDELYEFLCYNEPDGPMTPSWLTMLFSNISCGFSVFGDKDPLYSDCASVIAKRHQTMKFIVCLRNPYYVARSMWTPEAPVTEWWQTEDPTQAISQATDWIKESYLFTERVGRERFYVWRVEDLRDHPEASWDRVLDFINADGGNILNYHEDTFDYNHYDDIGEFVGKANDNAVERLHEQCENFNYDLPG